LPCTITVQGLPVGLHFDRKLLNHEGKVNPSAPQHRCWGLLRVDPERVFVPALKSRARAQSKGQYDISPVIEMDWEKKWIRDEREKF